jgi:succinyl-diaminopimelate desuccinylase
VQSIEGLKHAVREILDRHGLRHTLDWFVSALPYYSAPGRLAAVASTLIEEMTGRRPELSTGGGTSDGRFLAPLGAEVLELGVVNATIHMIDECCPVEDLESLHRVYHGLMARLLGGAATG